MWTLQTEPSTYSPSSVFHHLWLSQTQQVQDPQVLHQWRSVLSTLSTGRSTEIEHNHNITSQHMLQRQKNAIHCPPLPHPKKREKIGQIQMHGCEVWQATWCKKCPNHQYIDCHPPHLITAATLPCKLKCTVYTILTIRHKQHIRHKQGDLTSVRSSVEASACYVSRGYSGTALPCLSACCCWISLPLLSLSLNESHGVSFFILINLNKISRKST